MNLFIYTLSYSRKESLKVVDVAQKVAQGKTWTKDLEKVMKNRPMKFSNRKIQNWPFCSNSTFLWNSYYSVKLGSIPEYTETLYGMKVKSGGSQLRTALAHILALSLIVCMTLDRFLCACKLWTVKCRVIILFHL